MSSSSLLTECETAISMGMRGKSYSIGGRSYTREDLKELREFRKELRAEVARETNSGIEVSGITPVDD